jgi:hypothetical protein
VDLDFSITPALSIPQSGALLITLEDGFTFAETTCYNNFHHGSTINGHISCVISETNTKATILFEAEQPASLLVITARVQTGSDPGSIAFSTLYNSNKSTTLMETAALSPLPVDAKSAPPVYEVQEQVHMLHDIRAGSTGSLQLDIVLTATLLRNTGRVILSFPEGFAVAPGGALRCVFTAAGNDYMSHSCEKAMNPTLTITIPAPKDKDLSAGTVNLLISTINADNVRENGLAYPEIGGTYPVHVQVIGEDSDMEILGFVNVLPATPFQQFQVTPAHLGHSNLNIFTITLQPETDIPADGYLLIYFPTMDRWNNPLFRYDLGLALNP